MKKLTIHLALLAILLLSIEVKAQFSANNILEIQRGNLPNSDPADLITIYDQFDLKYRYKAFRLNTRLETFHALQYNPYSYTRLNQVSLHYKKKALNVKAGHIYETLGRGLLLRAYEIKNSIFEDRIYRSRQGFYKDILGASGSYRYKNINVKAVWGTTLNNQLPQIHPDSRLDEVLGTELNYKLRSHSFGGIYLNHKINENISHFASAFITGNFKDNFTYYGEIAKNVSLNPAFYTFSDNDQYGAYFNFNYSKTNLGVSLELKDYHNFTIGSGIADAPTLVKEQSYRLLNRSTHVAEFFDETGYQVEAYFNTPSNTFFTINHAFAINNFGTLKFNFYEFFLEAYLPMEQWQLKTFLDFSTDEAKGEKNRISVGAYYTYNFRNNWNMNSEFEYQNSKRTDKRFSNAYWGIYVSKSNKLSAGIQLELSNDPFILTNNQKLKSYSGTNISYKINNKNNVQLFAGERRGGPACTSGICYEVLDFKGVEFRYTLKI